MRTHILKGSGCICYQFNISVGYDLKGIKSEKIDTFINNMMNAEQTEAFQKCRERFSLLIDIIR